MPTTYWDYLRLEELLALQSGLADEDLELGDDEVRFIVVHQIDELWMKLVLRELAAARNLFRLDRVPETSLAAANANLRRVALIFQLMADHFRLMETMRTQNYLEFRDKLTPASGFQSAQLREIEILMGLQDHERVRFGSEHGYRAALRGSGDGGGGGHGDGGGSSSPALYRVERRLADKPSLKDAVYRWLARAPIHGSTPDAPDDDAKVERFVADFLAEQRRGQERRMREAVDLQAHGDETDRARLEQRYRNELESAAAYLRAEDVSDPAESRRVRRLRAAILFIDSNRDMPLLSWPGEIIDSLIAAEQAMLIFRQRHARMVERVIGRRVGTGGSDGVDYLDRTALEYRVFKEIWAARTMLMQKDQVPPVENPDYYGLRNA